MRRALTFGVALFVVTVAAIPASAQELIDYIDKQSAATYSGDQTVVCVTPDGNLTQLASVQQTAGIRLTELADGSLVVSQVGAAGSRELAPRYDVTEPRPGAFLNRAVVRYNVLDGEVLRMALTFDQETGALLSSQTFNADGSLYCRNRLLTFQDTVLDQPSETYELEPQGVPVDDPSASIAHRLPEQIASFQRVGVYDWPDRDIVTGHYSDGLFSMTIFTSERSISVPELDDSDPVELASGTYRRAFDVGSVVYAWRTGAGGYILVGDLTLDMQEEVLALLPAPEQLNFFSRLWRSIFRR